MKYVRQRKTNTIGFHLHVESKKKGSQIQMQRIDWWLSEAGGADGRDG